MVESLQIQQGERIRIRREQSDPAPDLMRLAQQCAAACTLAVAPAKTPDLFNRVAQVAMTLRQAHRHFLSGVAEGLSLPYVAEWLLDNFHLVEQALRQIKLDLPIRYYRQLPQANDGLFARHPRIYAFTHAFVLHEECHFTANRYRQFVAAYQTLQPLTIGELWAMPTMMRIALLEQLAYTIHNFSEEPLAAELFRATLQAERTSSETDTAGNSINSLRAADVLDWKVFIEQVSLVQQMLYRDPLGVFESMDFQTRDRYRQVVESVAQRMNPQQRGGGGGEAEIAVAQQAVALAQAAQQADAHLNTHLDSHLDVQRHSLPALNGIQTSESGRRLEQAVEIHTSPSAITHLNLCQPRTHHVGYYLLDAGRAQLEAKVGYRPTLGEHAQRWLLQHAKTAYLGAIFSLSLLMLGLIVAYAIGAGGSWWMVSFATLLAITPVGTVCVNFVNWLVTQLLPPRILPKLDFEAGIPAQCRSMVVTPVLLTQADEVEGLFDQLELHYLRNPERSLTFAILSDFGDAAQPEMPSDAALIASAQQRLTALNQKYPHQPFYLLHRRRLWNPSENTWMGWERKRGKLHEFNQLLRGSDKTSFNVQLGDLSVLAQIQYVITLDADTVLPSEGAQRLVGTLAHPLNRALFDESTGKVVAGYTVLQPRTAIKPTSANLSLFTRIFSGDVGIDLYTRAVSDAYHDLFGTGIYVGKGIYAVDSFERSLVDRVPENTLLSHDLFEGVHGRAGLVTDIVLYESYPPHYLVNVMRSHRWVRGDWQLLPWLWRRSPRQTDNQLTYQPNDLPLLARWKIADNLRRSLFPPILLMLFVAGWTILPGGALFWTAVGLLPPLVSLLTVFLNTLWGKLRQPDRPWRLILPPVRNDALRWLLFLAFLPFESLVLIDAIVTTLNRLFLSRRRLLQWTTAEHAIRLMGGEITSESTFRRMLPSMLLVILALVVVALVAPISLWVAVPFVLLWLGAWRIAFWISRPDPSSEAALSSLQVDQLHRLARRTWLFYEEFVGPDDNWLPPDHFQESPRGVVAHRTSPTNIGLYLLSALAAYDLGYMTTTSLSLRLRFAFETLAKLERYRGHFLNWIDTRTLAPLTPRYVSTVDSGNLAACLIALRQGCLSLPSQPFWRRELWQGVIDLFSLLDEAVREMEEGETAARLALAVRENSPLSAENERTAAHFEPDAGEERSAAARLRFSIVQSQQKIRSLQDQPEAWAELLFELSGDGRRQLDALLMRFIEAHANQFSADQVREFRILSEAIHYRFDNMQREIQQFMPWLAARLRIPTCLAQTGALGSAENALTVAWQALWQQHFIANPTLDQIAALCVQGEVELETLAALATHHCPVPADLEEVQEWCHQLHDQLQETQLAVEAMLATVADLAEQAGRYVHETEFTFLLEPHRQVFHIGYNLDAGRLDNSFYDLIASEARLASLIAIAKKDVPYSHWLHLGRPVTQTEHGEQALLSWSGTMFEYLMPPLFTNTYAGTLLHQSYYSCIDHQIAYGQAKKVPWGISESGFYTFDASMNYQYYAFGVPGLGFKREQGEDLVITPYASLLALSFRPQAVLANIDALRQQKMIGRFGLYEAADYTPVRLSIGQEKGIVRSYMAHHQGMILLSLANFLQGNRMVQRFHADPRIQSVEMLLQEQIPHTLEFQFPHEEAENIEPSAVPSIPIHPWRVANDTPIPLVHYLSNGRYSVLISNSGAGYSQWNNLQLTRWQPDTTLDADGSWIYLHDLDRNVTWSATRQPLNLAPAKQTMEQEEVTFHPHMVKFVRQQEQISLHTEIVVAVEDDVEIRRLTLTNLTDQPRHLRLTSYGEVVLAPAAADRRHQAFVKLFVESEFISELGMQLFRRRPRSSVEDPHFLGHMLTFGPGHEANAGLDDSVGELSYESNRARFLGRGGSAGNPLALQDGMSLTGRQTQGGARGTRATLDPILALSQELRMAPHATLQVALLTFSAPSRPALLTLARRYHTWTSIDRAFMHARNEIEAELRQLDLPSPLLEQIQVLLSLLLYPNSVRRAPAATLAANQKGQSGLWAFGISGDYPILLLCINDETEGELLQQVLLAHTYWRRRNLQIDVVILNQQPSNYGQDVQNFIHRTIRRLDSEQLLNQRGGLFVLYQDQLGEADLILLQCSARVVLQGQDGLLHEQLRSVFQQPVTLPYLMPTPSPDLAYAEMLTLPRPTDLCFDNGLGGFTPDGREYVIYLEPGQHPPAPWSNVIANPNFGALVTESGAGYSWSNNSGENRLTSWRNDPVSDLPSEVLYLRDEETAQFWSPTPLPTPARNDQPTPYLIRHGAGYTSFEHHSHQLKQHLRLFVAPDAPVKILHLRLENVSQRVRRITATFYAEWVLGVERASMQQYIIPDYEAQAWTLLARNPYNSEFGERVAFVASNKEPHGLTTDRSEFLGRLGSLRHPAALERVGLSGRVEAGLDPCAVLQLHIDLPPGGSEEIYFLIGQTSTREEALQLVRRFQERDGEQGLESGDQRLTGKEDERDPQSSISSAWQQVQSTWDEILGTIQVETPDAGFNLLLNRWLLYQTLACRIWGRSALYQSSGAYGFRDQLQDVMALTHARPDLVRQHIIESAQHQFEAGDVLHWWHPPSGRGVRTRISDDLLWLPYVTAYYVRATGDLSILETQIAFLQGDPLRPNEEERYAHYATTPQTGSLFEHCRRALHKGTTAGKHGLPLMGGGDWNDGMNRVGIHGQGESVWLGWFLCATLNDFAGLCEAKGENNAAAAYRQQASTIHSAVEEHAWDGKWYQRAWYDDGTPLGSRQSRECQIDSIAQSWAVLSGMGDRQRTQQAMQSVLERLVNWQDGLILLFTPPFDKTSHDPGYIKGYLPGIRENGGQYTHAALWTVWAFAQLGQGDLAMQLFKLISPITHGDNAEKVARYKVEPYVVAADIYGVAQQAGRGGWTWYTGSAGWMYRLGIEAILGIRREADRLWINPCVPTNWPKFAFTYRPYRLDATCYRVNVENPQGVNRGVKELWLDGIQLDADVIPLLEDGKPHEVRVVLG